MAVPVPFRLRIPSAAEQHIGKAVAGATLGKNAGAENCLAGYRGLGWHCIIPTVRRGTSTKDTGIPWGLSDRSEEHSIWIRTSPLAQRMELVACVASATDGGTTAPWLRVSLYDDTGGAIDVGVEWSRDGGTLMGQDAPILRRDGPDERRCWPYIVATNGERGDHFAAGASASDPRMLYLDGHGGEEVNVIVISHGVHLLSLTVIEFPEATL